MSGPACTTTYQCPLAGGYLWLRVVLVSAMPWPSATTWFNANAMPPRCWQLPRWMWETCEEAACRLMIFSSIVVLVGPGVTRMVPLAVTPGSGLILKVCPEGNGVSDWLGDCSGLADGEGVAAVSPPHAAMNTAIASVTIHALADVIAAPHRVQALPVQVTGAGRDFTPARQRRRSLYACRGATGAAGLRRLHSRKPSPARTSSGPTAPRA